VKNCVRPAARGLRLAARPRIQAQALGPRPVSHRWDRTAVLSLLLLVFSCSAFAGSLPYAPALVRCYDAILDARFDDAETEIERACGPAPAEACGLMSATALWWRIQMDPFDRSRDANFRSRIDAVIDSIERWTGREPKRADAWFFLGAAYGLRVDFRVLRTERLAAARDGKRIKDALERSLALDPNMQDAYFGIGLYHYYAAIAPAALRIVRWILFLPGSDRVEGLREMVQARDHGELLRGEADFQLQAIYLWYEQNVDEALKLLDGLRATYPHNPLFLQSIADVHHVYRHDDASSLDAWRVLFTLARARRVSLPEMSEVRARLGMAAELDALYETDAAIDQLRAVVDANPSAPYGSAALAQYRLGAAYDRMGYRDRAVAAYQAALASAPPDDPDTVRTLAREGIRRRPDARAAEAYRLSIEGFRYLQRNAMAQAADSLNRSAAINPADPVTAFRQASLLLKGKRDQDALAEFERIVAMRPMPPPAVLASSCVEAGRLLEASGHRERAIEMYRRASRVRGADARARQAATKALDRLHVPQSSR
jgi:tetratricopeptide (TPR) repeat protein